MISTVAVGTDGSETASEAVKQAAEFARRFDAELVLLSAFKAKPPPPDAGEAQWAYSPSAQLREILSRTEVEMTGGSSARPWSTRGIPPTCWCALPMTAARMSW